MPRTVAPRTATRVVLNWVSHLSLATIPVIRGGPVTATGDSSSGRGGCGRRSAQGSIAPDPVTHNTDVSPLVGAVDADEVVDLVVGVDRLPGVAPEALEDVVLHAAPLDVPVVDVGDLQLAPARGLEGGDDVEDVLVVEVDAGDHVVAGRVVGLLEDADDPAVAVELGHAEVAQVGRVVDAGQDEAGPGGLGQEVGHGRAQAALDHVVGQHDHHPVPVDEALGQPEGLGDPARPLLVGVQQPVDAVLVAVAEQPQELAGMGPPGDHHQLGDPGRDEGLDGVGDHRPVVDRQQVLVGDAGQRVEPRAGPPGQDDAFHAPYLVRRPAAASSWGSRCLASKRPREPWRQLTSSKPPRPSAAAVPPHSSTGTGCQEWAAIWAGVEWSPVTAMTSIPDSRMWGMRASTSSMAATLRSKSPSSPAESVFLMCMNTKSWSGASSARASTSSLAAPSTWWVSKPSSREMPTYIG